MSGDYTSLAERPRLTASVCITNLVQPYLWAVLVCLLLGCLTSEHVQRCIAHHQISNTQAKPAT